MPANCRNPQNKRNIHRFLPYYIGSDSHIATTRNKLSADVTTGTEIFFLWDWIVVDRFLPQTVFLFKKKENTSITNHSISSESHSIFDRTEQMLNHLNKFDFIFCREFETTLQFCKLRHVFIKAYYVNNFIRRNEQNMSLWVAACSPL